MHLDLTFNSGHIYRIFHEEEDMSPLRKCIQEILYDGVYESDTVRVTDGDHVIDGGAYLGVFIYYAIELGAAYVTAFEPHRRKFDLLQKSIIENGMTSCVHCVNAALWSASNEWVKFLVYRSGPMGSKVVAKNEKGTYKVPTVTIDAFNRKIDFIKLDVEGSEAHAIVGATRTILDSKPKLAISLYHREKDITILPQALKDLGYSDPVKISDGKYCVGVWDRAKY